MLGKYLVYADAQEPGITPHLAMDGYWESWITLVLARTVRPAPTVSTSAQSRLLHAGDGRRRGPERPRRPVEPTPRLAEMLRQTLDINGFPDVEVLAKAASDTDGETLQLVIPARRSLNARLAEEAGPTDEVVPSSR